MLHRGAYSIVLSRRITDHDGSFLGVVVGSIRFSYFHDLFGRLTLDPGDTITVLRRDRTIIMRTPFDLDIIGKNLAERKSWSADEPERRRSICRRRAGRSDAAALRSKRQHEFVLCRGRKAAGDDPEALAQGSDPDRRDHDGADRVRGRHRPVPRARDRPARGGRGQAGRTRDNRRAYRTEEPAQIRSRDRCGVAARGAQQDTGRGPDDRCRSFQSLQRHLWASGRRSGAGRHCHLHFGLSAAGRRLCGALRRRGVRGAVAGALRRSKRSLSPKPSG